jgi:hypothetical protein
MKPSLPNAAQCCAPIISISSLSSSSRAEVGRIYLELTGSSGSNTGRSRFIIVEIPAETVSAKSVKGEPEAAPQILRNAEIRKVYNENYSFYESEYLRYIKKTGPYGAKEFAAKKMIEKIWDDRQIALSLRNVIVAMNLRMLKNNLQQHVNDMLM